MTSSATLASPSPATGNPRAEDPAKAELVKLRFFGGLTMPEIAEVMKISLATAERHWTYARTWLFAEVRDRGDTANASGSSSRLEGFRAGSSY